MWKLHKLIGLLVLLGLYTDDGGNPDGGDQGDDDNDDGGQPAAAKVEMTQAQLDKLIEGRVAKATKAAAGKVAEELGVSVTEAKQIIEARKAADDAAKTETERALDAAAKAKAEADAERVAAQSDRLAARIERELSARGIDGPALDRIAQLVDYTSLDDDVVAAVDAVAADLPGLFTPAQPERTGGGSSLPRKRHEPKPAPQTSLEKGRAAAARRFGTTTTKE